MLRGDIYHARFYFVYNRIKCSTINFGHKCIDIINMSFKISTFQMLFNCGFF